jgi:hypothetical protein
MIPPSPMQFTLWGSALYTELATGLWRALAAPWLEPGWPGWTWAPDRHRLQEPRPAPAAGPANCEPTSGRSDRVDETCALAEAPEHRVIEVPRARWQGRRAAGATLPNER